VNFPVVKELNIKTRAKENEKKKSISKEVPVLH
jgi:hypothetical protein